MSNAILRTPSEVIDALGGTSAVAALTKSSVQAVTNWRRKRLAPRTFIVLTAELQKQGLRADPALWGMETAQ